MRSLWLNLLSREPKSEPINIIDLSKGDVIINSDNTVKTDKKESPPHNDIIEYVPITTLYLGQSFRMDGYFCVMTMNNKYFTRIISFGDNGKKTMELDDVVNYINKKVAIKRVVSLKKKV